MIDFKLETISVEDAARILNEHAEAVNQGLSINRSQKPAAIRRYAADQQSGQWFAETGETLKFQTKDERLSGRNLVDGQNRLAACVQSNVPLTVYVARGVAREAFSYIDGGEKRSLRDVLLIDRETEATNLAATLGWLCKWDSEAGRINQNVSVTIQRAKRFLASDPAVRKSVEKAKAVKEEKLMGVGIAAFLHRIFSDHFPEKADEFIAAIVAGTNLPATDPYFMLRKVLIQNKSARRKFKPMDIIALSIKAWNAKVNGQTLKVLKLIKGESMPTLLRSDQVLEETA